MYDSRRLPGEHGTFQCSGESSGDDLDPMCLRPSQAVEISTLHVCTTQDADKFPAGARGPGERTLVQPAPGEFG